MPEYDPLYVGARTVLLDALEALGSQRDAIIVVGAQAVYMRTGDSVIAIAPTRRMPIWLFPRPGLPTSPTLSC
jgi:heptaprenylglyceryl phosphate synthase